MSVAGNRVVAVLFVGLGLLAVAVVPFLVIPVLVAVALTVAVRLRTAHPSFSRAWLFTGLSVGLLAAAIGASIFLAPQVVVTILLVLSLLAYATTVVLFGYAGSRGSDYPWASWVSAVALGLVGLLCVVLLGSFGRGIALADQGESSWLIDMLILVSAVGIPTLLITGLIALSVARRQRTI